MKTKILGIFVMTLLIATSVLPMIGNANDNKNSFSENWPEQDKITASDGAAGDYFGYSVSIDGDYALIGAYYDGDNGPTSGSAYVFKRSGATWTEEAKLTASDGAVGDCFGISVSIDGDYALIGAYGNDDNGDYSGSAYVFKRSGTTWTEEAKLTASDGAADDYFGRFVSIDGDYALIGAFADDDNGANSGSAYVFKRSGTTWTEEAKLTASDGAADDYFGCSVSVNGDYALLTAYGDDDNGVDSGSAYVFMYENTPPCGDFTYSPINPTTSDIVQFTNTSTDINGYIVSWDWDFGDGNVSSIPDPTHQYNSNGIYEVTLEVTDDEGGTDDISKIVPVGINIVHGRNISSGWNLIAVPSTIDKSDFIIKYDGCYYNWAQSVQETIVNQYVFGWNNAGQYYQFVDMLEPWQGYWMYAYQPCTLKRVI